MIENGIRTQSGFMISGMLNLFDVKLFMTRNVSELISGYTDPLLNLGQIADPSKVKSPKFSLLNDVKCLINKFES